MKMPQFIFIYVIIDAGSHIDILVIMCRINRNIFIWVFLWSHVFVLRGKLLGLEFESEGR